MRNKQLIEKTLEDLDAAIKNVKASFITEFRLNPDTVNEKFTGVVNRFRKLEELISIQDED